MKAKDFDKKFDQAKEDIIDDLDLSKARRVNQVGHSGCQKSIVAR